MCGIFGYVGLEAGGRQDVVGPALRALASRGPDGGGRALGRLGALGVELGARRLALVDVAGGNQPIRRPSGALLVFNGEIYNHASLRDELHAEGERFETLGDGEVLAALLERHGVDGLARAEGSYAFAFLGANHGPLLLGRDPSGVRPLVVAALGNELIFASTLEGILATGRVPREPDIAALCEVLRDGVVHGGRTALRSVSRVPPGIVLRVDGDLKIERLVVPCRIRLQARPAHESTDVLAALRAAVRDRLAVDRPSGLALSGGIDSALLAVLCAEVSPIQAFTLGYPAAAVFDETQRARQTARRLGLPHETVACPADPSPWVMGVVQAFDEPFADASAIPTWGLARAMGRQVRVALSGTGGDEVFGGYRRYWLLGTGPWLRNVPVFLRQQVASLLSRHAPQGARLLSASEDPEGLYRGLLRLQPVEALAAVLSPVLADVVKPAARGGPTTPEEAMADDLARYLPDDLLVKEDRAFMAHGVEGRHPFLDSRVRRAAHDLDHRGSLSRGRQKQFLRAFVRENVDPHLARVAKHGFAFPIDAMYRGPLRPLAEDVLLGQRTRERGWLAPVGTRRLLQQHLRGQVDAGQTLHALLMLELWARRVLDAVAV